MSNPVRVGIAGLGRSGWDIHAAMLEPLSDMFRIVHAFDGKPERLKESQTRFGCRATESYENLLKDPEVELVVVAMPSHLHVEYSIAALQAGKHVVCEKPLAITSAEADCMIAVARSTGWLLCPFQNARYLPDFVKVREVIASGKLGRIVQIVLRRQDFQRRWDWLTLRKFGGGTLYNTGPHFVDQALLLFGDAEEPEVWCHRDKVLSLGDAEDHLKILLRGRKSPLIEIELTSACAYPAPNWIIMGSLGGLTSTADGLSWKYLKPEDLPPRRVEEAPVANRSYSRENYNWITESWNKASGAGPGPVGYYLDVYDSIRNRSPLAVTPESVRRQIAVLEKCQQVCSI